MQGQCWVGVTYSCWASGAISDQTSTGQRELWCMLDATKRCEASEGIRTWQHSGNEGRRRTASLMRRLARGRSCWKETAPSIAKA